MMPLWVNFLCLGVWLIPILFHHLVYTFFRHNFNVISSEDFLEDNLSYFTVLENSGPVSTTELIMLQYTAILNMCMSVLTDLTVNFSRRDLIFLVYAQDGEHCFIVELKLESHDEKTKYLLHLSYTKLRHK